MGERWFFFDWYMLIGWKLIGSQIDCPGGASSGGPRRVNSFATAAESGGCHRCGEEGHFAACEISCS